MEGIGPYLFYETTRSGDFSSWSFSVGCYIYDKELMDLGAAYRQEAETWLRLRDERPRQSGDDGRLILAQDTKSWGWARCLTSDKTGQRPEINRVDPGLWLHAGLAGSNQGGYVRSEVSGETLACDDNLTLVLRREEGQFTYSIYVKDQNEEELTDLKFVLQQSLEYRRGKSADDQDCFVWRDPDYGENDKIEFEFILPKDISDSTVQLFHLTIAQCLYESINKVSLDNASEKDIKSLMVVEGSDDNDIVDIHPGAGQIEGSIVYKSETAGFYIFDSSTNIFMPRADQVTAIISEPANTKAQNFEYTLSILDLSQNQIIHQQIIDPDATLHTDRSTSSFIWCCYTKEGLIWTYSLRFPAPPALMGFSNAIGQAIYEILNKESFNKVEPDNIRYVLNNFAEDVEMESAPSEDDQTEPESDSEEFDGDDNKIASKGAPDKNAQLAVGYKYDRSFVSRGPTIGVFKHTDDKLQFSTNVESLKTSSGKSFTPSKMMLHEEDSSLLLMNPDDRHKIFKMDLERGSIVEEWNVHPDAEVKDIIPDSKYAQMTGTKTLIGINDNSLFRIDPRLSGHKRVDSEMKQYVVKNQFTRGATTGKGELAVASAKGEIRLFDKLDKRAKTLLPGFGDPIIGIDVTESGRLIVATCKNYLLLINTEIEKDVLGFNKSMGAEKPTPKRLQLKPEHVAYMGSSVSFTPARFSTGSSEERSIITSTGPYVITWNLRRVKQGKLFDYQIKRYEDTVVADNFRFGQDRNIVVTLPDHVTMISKKSLSAPSPSILSGGSPRKSTRHSDIVHTPY